MQSLWSDYERGIKKYRGLWTNYEDLQSKDYKVIIMKYEGLWGNGECFWKIMEEQ